MLRLDATVNQPILDPTKPPVESHNDFASFLKEKIHGNIKGSAGRIKCCEGSFFHKYFPSAHTDEHI